MTTIVSERQGTITAPQVRSSPGCDSSPRTQNTVCRPCVTTNTTWNKLDVPGGRDLWYRMVVGVIVFALVGLCFVAAGSVFLYYTSTTVKETSLPAVFCIFGIVLGVAMVGLSATIAKLFISNKWRKNEQPTYTTTRHQRQGHNRVSIAIVPEARIPVPPTYEESVARNDPYIVYTVSRPEPKTFAPPSYSVLPPSYEESNQRTDK